MLPVAISQSNQLALSEVIARLALHDLTEQSMVNFAPGSAFEPEMAERGLACWESLLAHRQ